MAFAVRVLADSVSPTRDRLTTVVATYPRMIHSELLTHRLFSRSSASSRAIPVEKMLKMIEEDPVVPIWWGKNQGGMQAHEEIDDKAAAEAWWREGVAAQIAHARRGLELNLHKQVVNRVVETGMWITVIISSTTWSNFQALRVHKDAEPHFQRLADMIMEAIAASTPAELPAGEWHLPLIYPPDVTEACALVDKNGAATDKADFKLQVDLILRRVSVGRCARVSYLTHDGRRDLQEDIKLHDRLMVQEPLHASPAEHVAQALDWPWWLASELPELAGQSSAALNRERFRARELRTRLRAAPDDRDMLIETALAEIQSGNFRGFRQYRKTHPREHIGEPMP